MKKAVSLLLVLSMALALCACGSGKQAKSDPAANDGVGFSADKIESISENMDDMLDIEAVKVTHDSVYYARIKNNYTVKEGDEPNRIMLQFNLIDKQGAAIENSYMIFDGVEPNKSCWGYIPCQTKYTDISAIEFLGYMFQFDTHNINDPSAIYGLKMMGGGSFTEPIVYSVEDIEIEGVTQESPATSESVLCDLGDTISTGTLELTVSSAEFCEAVQAGSNISMGAPRDDMILGCFEITVKDVGKELFNVLVVWHLAYNQSCWTKTGVVQGGDDSFNLSEISAIQVSYYEMRTVIGGRVSWQNEWDFLSPIKFNVADLEIEKA